MRKKRKREKIKRLMMLFLKISILLLVFSTPLYAQYSTRKADQKSAAISVVEKKKRAKKVKSARDGKADLSF